MKLLASRFAGIFELANSNHHRSLSRSPFSRRLAQIKIQQRHLQKVNERIAEAVKLADIGSRSASKLT